jgi:hypothetical protein
MAIVKLPKQDAHTSGDDQYQKHGLKLKQKTDSIIVMLILRLAQQ